MAVHTAIFRLVNLDSSGKRVKKEKDATVAQVMKSSSEHRIFEYRSGSAPNAANNSTITPPTLHDYLNAEDGDGYQLVHLDQTFVITSNNV